MVDWLCRDGSLRPVCSRLMWVLLRGPQGMSLSMLSGVLRSGGVRVDDRSLRSLLDFGVRRGWFVVKSWHHVGRGGVSASVAHYFVNDKAFCAAAKDCFFGPRNAVGVFNDLPLLLELRELVLLPASRHVVEIGDRFVLPVSFLPDVPVSLAVSAADTDSYVDEFCILNRGGF